MYRLRVAADIAAPPGRVWSALCDPAEVVLWDSSVIEALDAPPDYPRPGQRVRWRLRGTAALLVDCPQVVQSERVLRSLLQVGRLRLDETYTLEPLPDGVRLTAIVDVTSPVPLLDRLRGPAVRRDFAASLAAIKRRCEAGSGRAE